VVICYYYRLVPLMLILIILVFRATNNAFIPRFISSFSQALSLSPLRVSAYRMSWPNMAFGLPRSIYLPALIFIVVISYTHQPQTSRVFQDYPQPFFNYLRLLNSQPLLHPPQHTSPPPHE